MTMYVLYSDLHIRPERLEDCETVLKFIGEFAEKNKAQIINGGDTFNTRGMLKTHCFDVIRHHYDNWFNRGLRQFIIVGNHDQEDKAGEIHPMKIFSTFEGWHVIDHPQIIEGMGFSPYVQQPNLAIEAMKGAKDVFVHWGFQGARRNNNNVDADGVDPLKMASFRNVFSGHYHFRNDLLNIRYIGSPFQQNHGEHNQDKGVLLYDNKANKVTFHEIPKTSKHYDVQVTIVDGKVKYADTKHITMIDKVRVKIVGDIESVSGFSKDQALAKIKCADVQIDREVTEKHFTRLNIKSEEIDTPISLMEKYVDFVETGLNKSKLIEIGKELIE